MIEIDRLGRRYGSRWALLLLGDPMGQARSWILLLIAFDAIYWSLCGLLFGRWWRSDAHRAKLLAKTLYGLCGVASGVAESAEQFISLR